VAKIDGGAVHWARQTEDSEIFTDKPHVWFKIWFMLVGRAKWKKEGRAERGQCFMKYEWIAEKTKATRAQIDMFMRWAKKEQMLTTQKTTRGMIVSVCKYDYFQDLGNYKNDTENDSLTIQKRYRNDTIPKKDKNGKKGKNITYTSDFLEFWSCYPKKEGKGKAFESWVKMNGKMNLSLILEALAWQKKTEKWTKKSGQFIPMPTTYLNQRRWEDEPDVRQENVEEDLGWLNESSELE